MSQIAGVQLELNGADKVSQSVGSIRKQLREATQEAIKISQEFGELSAEALAAAQKVANLKDQIADTNERVALFDPGAKFQVFTNTLATAAGGVSALQGAMGLLGNESEDVQKALLKVQSALALSQGLSVIADSAKDFQRLGAVIQQTTVFTKANELANKATAVTMRVLGVSAETTSVSFKVLKGAIAATGIGLLVIALAEAVVYFQNFTSAAEDAAKAQEELNKKISESAQSALKAQLDTLDREQRILVARAKARGATEEEIFKIEQDGRRLRANAIRDFYNEVKDADSAAAEQAKNDLANTNADALVAQANFQEQQRKAREAAAKEAKAKAEELAMEQAELEKKRLDGIYQLELDAYNKRKALRGKEQQDIVDSYQTLYERELEARKAVEEKKKQDEELFQRFDGSPLAKRLDAEIQARAENLEKERQISEANKTIAKAESEARIAAIDATQQAITNLALIAGRETVAGKALAVAASIINTYAAIAKTLNAFAGVPIPGYAIAQAIATGIAGLAAVKNIVAVQVPGGGGGGSAPSAPNLNTGSPLQPTTIGTNQVTLDSRSINAIGNRSIRAYVVESEISATQQKVRKIQRQTTFG